MNCDQWLFRWQECRIKVHLLIGSMWWNHIICVFSDVQVVYTKKSLQKKGYYSVEFSHLPHDMSMGSRELLLAFGWLLSTQRLLDKALETSVSPLEMALPISDKVLFSLVFIVLPCAWACWHIGSTSLLSVSHTWCFSLLSQVTHLHLGTLLFFTFIINLPIKCVFIIQHKFTLGHLKDTLVKTLFLLNQHEKKQSAIFPFNVEWQARQVLVPWHSWFWCNTAQDRTWDLSNLKMMLCHYN